MEPRRAKITYPCLWLFKIIGQEESAIRQAINEVTTGNETIVTPSNRSSGGRYRCLNLEMTVSDEASRDRIYLALKNHPDIKMVL